MLGLARPGSYVAPGEKMETALPKQGTKGGGKLCPKNSTEAYQKQGKWVPGRKNIQCPLQAALRSGVGYGGFVFKSKQIDNDCKAWEMLILLEKTYFQAAAFDSTCVLVPTIFIKAGAQKLSTWQHIVNGLIYCMWWGAL